MYYDGSNIGLEHNGESAASTTVEVKLEPGEFITTVTGRSYPAGNTAQHLEFTSNRGKLPLSIPKVTLLMSILRQKMGPVWEQYQR